MTEHAKISYTKSGLRILGLVLLAVSVYSWGFTFLIVAELLGIAEEFGL